jgi:DNA polymerase
MNQVIRQSIVDPTQPQEATNSDLADGADLAAALSQQLDSLRLAGVNSLPVVSAVESDHRPAEEPAEEPKPTVPDVAATPDQNQDTQNEPPMPPTKRKNDPSKALQVICDEVSSCTQCEELASTRNKTVFGVGNPKARLCFLGEAPGADEDKTGEPFVGRAGKLLTKIIEACTLTRDDVYILNMLKCRPPENRNPLPGEMENCDGFLKRQLEVIQPEFICCLGAVSAKTLLKSDLTIGKLRGEFHEWNGIKVLATYHPAYLLRNPPAKAEVWKDMQFLMKAMGIKLPKE